MHKLRALTQPPPLGFLHEQRLLDDGFQQLLSSVLGPQFRCHPRNELAVIRYPNRRLPHLDEDGVVRSRGGRLISAGRKEDDCPREQC